MTIVEPWFPFTSNSLTPSASTIASGSEDNFWIYLAYPTSFEESLRIGHIKSWLLMIYLIIENFFLSLRQISFCRFVWSDWATSSPSESHSSLNVPLLSKTYVQSDRMYVSGSTIPWIWVRTMPNFSRLERFTSRSLVNGLGSRSSELFLVIKKFPIIREYLWLLSVHCAMVSTVTSRALQNLNISSPALTTSLFALPKQLKMR